MASEDVVLASTAFMNQPASRAFRVVLVWKAAYKAYVIQPDDEYICWYQGADGAKWEGAYFSDQQSAWLCFAGRAERHIRQTFGCAERLEPKYQPFISAAAISSITTNDQFRW